MPCFDSHPANWQKVTLWSGFAHASLSTLRFMALDTRALALHKAGFSSPPALVTQAL